VTIILAQTGVLTTNNIEVACKLHIELLFIHANLGIRIKHSSPERAINTGVKSGKCYQKITDFFMFDGKVPAIILLTYSLYMNYKN